MADESQRVALVTGAGNGIGAASARAFAAAGYAVVLADIDEPAAEAHAHALREDGRPALAIACDVADDASIERCVARALSRLGRLDAVHANAAIGEYALLEEAPVETIRRIVDVDLTGQLLLARAALPELRRRSGSIVFTASVQGHTTLPGCVAYAACKAGLMAAARALAVEVGGDGVRVNSVSPGTIDTPMLRRDLEGMNVEEADAFLGRVEGANALGRIGQPEEVASAVVWLCSTEASYVTGTDLVIDGGYLRVKRF